ncbi:MAG: hypothetical protein WED33_10740 [Bacteroidia bacterium]
MRKINFLLAIIGFVGCIENGFSQDIITLKSGEEINAKVIEINSIEIKYKKFDYQAGPLIILPKSDVFMVKYPNGSKDVFSSQSVSSGSSSVVRNIDGSIALSAGANVQIELAETLNSKTISPGQTIYFRVKFDVLVENTMLIKAGQSLQGVITKAQKARELGKQGELSIQVSSVQAIDGQEVMLSGNIFREGENRSVESIGIGALIFWPVLFMKGREAEIVAGTVFNAQVGQTIYIKPIQ